MNALRVERLSKNFGGLQVLHNVSFGLKAGEKVAVIGPNGAGKTTLLNVLGGELYPASGRIFFFGHDVTNMPVHRRAGLGVGRSFQLNSLFYNSTVLDNAVLALQATQPFRFQMFRPITAFHSLFEKAGELLGMLGLWEKRNAFIKDLSHGEQRQVEIALSLASRPKLLLLDEPTSGLSGAESAMFADIIRNLVADTAVFFCAHDMDIVFGLADRIVVLYYGQIIAEGSPQQIQADPKVREIYLGVE